MRRRGETGRPDIPGYGIHPDGEGILPWSFVDKRMSSARNYWVSTTRSDGRPHAAPVWGVWLDGAFYFGTGSASRKARNLAKSPNVVVHLESGDEVVIFEGGAEEVADPALLDAAFRAKYGIDTGEVEGVVCGRTGRRLRLGGERLPQYHGSLALPRRPSPSKR
jgi:hypothetical protein